MCHGAEADGKGTLSKYFLDETLFPNHVPALKGRSLPDQYIFLRITNGVQRDGMIIMPSLSYNLTPGETWDIVNYILSLEE
jgi:hypothetical protein